MIRREPAYLRRQRPAEVPEPVLFNTWKHHACALRRIIQEYADQGVDGLSALAEKAAVIGQGLMDLYYGALSPRDIAARVIEKLRADDRLTLAAYRAWLQDNDGYRVLTFAEDGSRWVLRLGDEAGRHVHVHPGRWSPMTMRVRANALKSAVLVNAHLLVEGGDPGDIDLVNRVRRQQLNLSPMRRLGGDQGLSAVIELLRPEANGD